MWRLTGVVWAQAWFKVADSQPNQSTIVSCVPEFRPGPSVYVGVWAIGRHRGAVTAIPLKAGLAERDWDVRFEP